jgi:hypothetical protein
MIHILAIISLFLQRIEELEAENQTVEKEKDELKEKVLALEAENAQLKMKHLPSTTSKPETNEPKLSPRSPRKAREFMSLLESSSLENAKLREKFCELSGCFSEPFKRVKSGRVVVALPIAAPCCGKTTIITQLRKLFAEYKSLRLMSFLDDKRLLELHKIGSKLQAVVIVKSSDEFKQRMRNLPHNKNISEEEVNEKTHELFWTELSNDFAALCKFTSQTTIPSILFVDKNHMYNTYDKKNGLNTETHGWSITMDTLNKTFASLTEAKEVKGVDLQYLALTFQELVMGFDYDPTLWRHPFLPELLLELLRRAKTKIRSNTKTKTNKKKKEWALPIIKFLKTFTCNEMLPESSNLECRSKQSLSMLRSQGFHHFATMSLLEHEKGAVRKVALTTKEIADLALVCKLCPNYWDTIDHAHLEVVISEIDEIVEPLLGDIDRILQTTSVDVSTQQCVEALESALRDPPCPLSKAHEACERYRKQYSEHNTLYTFDHDLGLFFGGKALQQFTDEI